jgi:uncharacterized protein (TIGR04255 family)
VQASKPPVFLTFAVVRHEPLARLDKYIPDVQDALRKRGFNGPMMNIEARQQTSPSLAIAPTSPGSEVVERRYRIFTPDLRSAFTFSDQGVFAYHTTVYTTRTDLFLRVRMGLDLFHDIVQLQQINRVGIRMLDLIRPSDTGQELSHFVQPGLLGFRGIECPQGGIPLISSMEQSFRGETWEARARFDCLPDSFGLNSSLIFDIQGFQLPEHVVQGGRVLHGVLDTDSGTIGSNAVHAFDIDRVMTELAEHKTRISQLFRSAVTLNALKAWGLASP